MSETKTNTFKLKISKSKIKNLSPLFHHVKIKKNLKKTNG